MFNLIPKDALGTFLVDTPYGGFEITFTPDICRLASCCRDESGVMEASMINSLPFTHPDPQSLSDSDLQEIFWRDFAPQFHIEPPEAVKTVPRITVEVHLSGTTVMAVFKADGTGYMISSCGWTRWANGQCNTFSGPYFENPFVHDMPVTEDLAGRTKVPQDDDIVIDRYLEIFWDEINPSLPSPYMTAEDFEDQPLHLAAGTLEEMQAVIAGIVQIDDEFWAEHDDEEITVNVMAGWEEATPHIERETEDYRLPLLSEKSARLANLAVAYFEPTGYTVEYNDGSRIDWSGYDKMAKPVPVEVTRPTAIDRLNALARLETWFSEHMPDVDFDDDLI